jgi:hypothetical protein
VTDKCAEWHKMHHEQNRKYMALCKKYVLIGWQDIFAWERIFLCNEDK